MDSLSHNFIIEDFSNEGGTGSGTAHVALYDQCGLP